RFAPGPQDPPSADRPEQHRPTKANGRDCSCRREGRKMETSTKRRGASGSLDTGRPLDAAQARDGEAGRVLIVDDDASVRLVCAVNLEAEGLHVLEAADGHDALEQARRERPDLVLTDVTMPGLDGFQLAERLRDDKRTHGLPVIFLSGEVGQANAQRA